MMKDTIVGLHQVMKNSYTWQLLLEIISPAIEQRLNRNGAERP